MVDIGVSKSPAGNSVRVRVPPAAPIEQDQAERLAYIIGVALGDGNLSSPNGRVTRLRITCDTKYPLMIEEMTQALECLLPQNKVSIVKRKETYLDISVYSNKLNLWMPWRVGMGPKKAQKASVPKWILGEIVFIKACLRGLIQTDGCIYSDRGYTMVNFTNDTKELAEDFYFMVNSLGFTSSVYKFKRDNFSYKYTIRVAKNSREFIDLIKLSKS